MGKKLDENGLFATVGTFDGVHLGHRLLLSTLTDAAAERGMRATAFVLREHPLSLIAPERAPALLTPFADKAALVEGCGVQVIPLSFDARTRSLTSLEFMRLLRDEYGVHGLLVGHDNRFGSDRDADLIDYFSHGEQLGMEVIEAPRLPGISSSVVRKALLRGDVAAAARLLGRPYCLQGRVVHGQHLGARLGFPTANLLPLAPDLLIPERGVYSTRVLLPDGVYKAVTNIGVRPTVSDTGLTTIETHIPGFSADLYDQPISLDFIDKIRPEMRFSSLDELRARLALDISLIH